QLVTATARPRNANSPISSACLFRAAWRRRAESCWAEITMNKTYSVRLALTVLIVEPHSTGRTVNHGCKPEQNAKQKSEVFPYRLRSQERVAGRDIRGHNP